MVYTKLHFYDAYTSFLHFFVLKSVIIGMFRYFVKNVNQGLQDQIVRNVKIIIL